MKTEEFLDILELRQIVDASLVAKMREKALTSDRHISAKSVLKYLVKKELVSKRLAKELLDTVLTVSHISESSILGALPVLKPVADSPTAEPTEEASGASNIHAQEDDTFPTVEPGQPDEITDGAGEPLAEKPEPSGLFTDSYQKAEAAADDPFVEVESTDEQDKKTKSRKKRTKRENEWDSPLLLYGGGGLVLLILAGVVIGFLLNREDADAILKQAGDYFDQGSYTQSISQYQRFVEDYPNHPEFSQANVHLGMARLWKAANSTSDFATALETAQQVIEEIEDEQEFHLAQEDLASLLPKIAKGLAEQAEQSDQTKLIQQRVEQSLAALGLCNNTKYIPRTFRNEVLLEATKDTLNRVELNRERNGELDQALADIDASIAGGDCGAAYAIHQKLLKAHPTLMSSETLAAKVLEIAQAEQSVISFVAQKVDAETVPRPSAVVASLSLAQRSGEAAQDVSGTIAVRVDGALFGLQASDGTLLWRRSVGKAPNSFAVPLPEDDLLVVDANTNELLRLVGSTGELVWRQSFDSPIARPVLLGDRLLVASHSGKLHVLQLAGGEHLGYVQFGQPLRLPPAVGRQGEQIYVVGEHSSLYTLSADDFSCLGVHYLGHARGSVLVPPAIVLNKLIVAENSGVETSQLRVLEVDDSGAVSGELTRRRLHGLVITPLLTASRRLVALTSSGQIGVFEVGAGQSKQAFTEIASRNATGGEPIARFGLLHAGRLWVAGRELNQMAIVPTGNRLPVQNLDRNYTSDTFDHALQTAGNLLIHVRRPENQAGVLVGAMETSSGTPQWETELAVPLAGAPAVDARHRQITTVSASGDYRRFDRAALERRVQNRQAAAATQADRFSLLTEGVDLGQGRLVIGSNGSRRLLHVRPDKAQRALQPIELPAPQGCRPVPWGDGFVVPTTIGQVFYYDAEGGQSLCAPFQPPLTPETEHPWLTPAVYAAADRSLLVLSDGVASIFLLQLTQQPQPHLSAAAEAPIGPTRLNTRLAVLGELVCAGNEQGELACFGLPDLAAKPAVELGSEVAWGPFALGNRLLLATHSGELICLDSQPQIAWRQPLARGLLDAPPVAVGDEVLLLWREGALSRIRLADGSETAHLLLDESIVAGPIPVGEQWLLTSADGTLLMIDRLQQ